MTEPLLQMERAFFERLALVRSGGDSIRRSMATSSFYAAVEAAKTKKNGGSNRTAVKKVLLRTESHLPRGGFFLFCRRADHRGYKNRADNLRGFPSVLSALRLSVWLYNGYLLSFYIDDTFLFAFRTEQREVYQFCIWSYFCSCLIFANRTHYPSFFIHLINSPAL